eukprot:RCo039516
MADFLSEYAEMCEGFDFSVAWSEEEGKHVVARRDLPVEHELLEEVPFVAWATPVSLADPAVTFCDQCLRVLSPISTEQERCQPDGDKGPEGSAGSASGATQPLQCTPCGARFCSPQCLQRARSHGGHSVLCAR